MVLECVRLSYERARSRRLSRGACVMLCDVTRRVVPCLAHLAMPITLFRSQNRRDLLCT